MTAEQIEDLKKRASQRLDLMSDPSIRDMKKAILDAGCITVEKNWIDVDHIWMNPRKMQNFVTPFVNYLSQRKQQYQFTKLVVPVKVFGPFGILPFALLFSANEGTPLIIWKEFARPVTGESLFYGSVESNDRCLILHDVLNYGTTLLKEALDLRAYIDLTHAKGSEIVGALSLVARNRELLQMISERANTLVGSIFLFDDFGLKSAD